jgi:hypothetical protein
MGSVFINYRRGETAGEARALFNELAATLGKDSVFMDVDNIALGRDFRQVLQERLASCDLMLALIGKDWVDDKSPTGQRRLDNPSDFVRLEIEAALKRNIPVTPVLVQGAQMPSAEQLPESIKDFAYRNGFELSHNRWESDVQEMLKRLGLNKQQDLGAIRETKPPARRTPTENSFAEARDSDAATPAAQQPTRRPWFAIVGGSVLAIAVASGGLLYYRTVAEDNAKIEQARLESERSKAEIEARVAAEKAEADRARAEAKAAKAKAAAIQAERDQAAKDQAAAAQAAKDRAAVAQAERERAAAAQAERDRAAAAQAERERAAAAQGMRERPAAVPTTENSFLGNWHNADPAARNITRLSISPNGQQWLVHAWGACTPTDCDWGSAPATVAGNGLAVAWDQGFVSRQMRISRNGDRLNVAVSSVYRDNRAPNRFLASFVRRPVRSP